MGMRFPRFKVWFEAVQGQLQQQLMAIRPQLAAAAQQVYDAWDQDEEGMDDEYGGGGICHDIADALVNVVDRLIPQVEAATIPWSGSGEVHVYSVAILGEEACEVDIHPSTYETGGGYTWKKIPNVQFDASDIIIYPISVEQAREILEYDG
jgi:hypothetical protein